MAKKEKDKGKDKNKKQDKKGVTKAIAAEIRSASRIRPCTCPHEFQDKEYGRGMI